MSQEALNENTETKRPMPADWNAMIEANQSGSVGMVLVLGLTAISQQLDYLIQLQEEAREANAALVALGRCVE